MMTAESSAETTVGPAEEPPETSDGSDTDEGDGPRFGPIGSRVLALLVAVGLAVSGLAASVVFTIVLFLTGVVSLSSLASATGVLPTDVVVLALFTTEAGFLLVGFLYTLWRLDLVLRIPSRRDVGWILGTIVAALAAANGLHALAGALGLDPVRSVVDAGGGLDPVLYLVIGVLSIVLVGPAEELLFRGAIQGRLRTAFGPTVSILVASALFASFHVFNFQGSFQAVLFATAIIGVVGAILGVAYERTGNLAVSILAHGLYNATLTAVAYASAVGWF